MQNNVAVDKNSREYQENLFKSGRSNLLLVLIFTVINLVMLLIGSENYWLFSAVIPYYLTLFGMVWDGAVIGTLTITALVISAIILAAYLASWILSKKRSGWLIVALVLFALDTLGMIGLMILMGFGVMDMLFDVIFHAWVIIGLVRACMAAKKLKEMPETAENPQPFQTSGPELD